MKGVYYSLGKEWKIRLGGRDEKERGKEEEAEEIGGSKK